MIKAKDETLSALKNFFALEAAGGFLLVGATLLAITCVNTPLTGYYTAFLEFHIGPESIRHWINDGLMVIFFLLIGLEIKREVSEGELATKSQAFLPVFAALGGVICPALIYGYFNYGDSGAMRGWAIPSATDIAFSLGVLSLFGNRIPISLKIFLMAVAVIDDLMAILIIAAFYTSQISWLAIAVAGLCLVGLFILNRRSVTRLTPYMLLGIILWLAVLKSGIHATIAGVLLAMFIPLKPDADRKPMLQHLQQTLHPWVTYLILPIFAFANAGVSFEGLTLQSLLEPVPLGITAGLFFGKQAGIFLFSSILFAAGIARKPEGATWLQFYSICMIAGIGFTMSLFIGNLAFADVIMHEEVLLGVLAGSLLSAVAGALLLVAALKIKK